MSTTFRSAIESHDVEAAIALLTDDVEFHSPVVHSPYRGRDAVAPILRAVVEVFEDFRYVAEIGEGADEHVLVFRAHVGDREVEGIDLVRVNEDDLIDDFTVFVRPLSGLNALAARMAEELGATPA